MSLGSAATSSNDTTKSDFKMILKKIENFIEMINIKEDKKKEIQTILLMLEKCFNKLSVCFAFFLNKNQLFIFVFFLEGNVITSKTNTFNK